MVKVRFRSSRQRNTRWPAVVSHRTTGKQAGMVQSPGCLTRGISPLSLRRTRQKEPGADSRLATLRRIKGCNPRLPACEGIYTGCPTPNPTIGSKSLSAGLFEVGLGPRSSNTMELLFYCRNYNYRYQCFLFLILLLQIQTITFSKR